MKIELTAREIRLIASALQKEAVRLAYREREAGPDQEYEALWSKFIHLEKSAPRENKTENASTHDPETHP